jgi:hypothetical protein
MEIVVRRVLGQQGTNGQLFIDGRFVCYTIELPWRQNQRNVSCISAGRYTLRDHRSPTFGRVAYVIGTQPDRDFVYFHAANNALTELRGCIAPVTAITGEGRGTGSRAALNLFNKEVFAAFDRRQTVHLTIL